MKTAPRLRYDGAYDLSTLPADVVMDGRQWTIISDWFDSTGANRKYGSFMLEGLQEIGLIPTKGESK